ncbi:50S ribosomal protein L9 [Candidatus Parcubacteria bacterium]|nr:50S ribosomal protein L9 [Candidatus Parcubacteria bacterium]
MKVILLQDIDTLGKKHEVKEVKDGYVRNSLLPQGLVRQATPEALKWVEMQKEIAEKQMEEGLKKIQEVASAIDGQEITISLKVGDKGQLFESITPQKVVEEIKKLGTEVKKTQIEMEPIKECGEFSVKIKFDHNLEAEIKIIVVEDK